MKLAIGCDHGALELKNGLVDYLISKGYEVTDYGTMTLDSCDYVDYAEKVCEDVRLMKVQYGILLCTTGIGMSMAANKVPGVRAGLVSNVEAAHLTREHNNANVLCLGAKFTPYELAIAIVDEFLTTEFSNGPRHVRRLEKMQAIEEKYGK